MDAQPQKWEYEQPIEDDTETTSAFDMLEPLFTNLNATSTFRPGIVHDDSELSDSSVESVPIDEMEHTETRSPINESVKVVEPKFHIDLSRFASSSDLAQSVSRYRRYRIEINRQMVAMTSILTEYWPKLQPEGPPFRLGLIGAGIVGRTLIRNLLDAGIRSDQILVSTRRPETVEADIPACTNNGRVFAECDLALVCVLPNQLNAVAVDYRACTAPRSLLVVLSSAMPLGKLQIMFGRETILNLAGIGMNMTYYEDLAANIQTQLIQRFTDKFNDDVIKNTADIHDHLLSRIRLSMQQNQKTVII